MDKDIIDSASTSGVSRRNVLRLGLTAGIVGGGAALLAACSNSPASAASTGSAGGTLATSLLDTIQKRGVLNVMGTPSYKPQFYLDSNGNHAGYDAQVISMLSSDLNVKPQYHDIPGIAEAVAGLQSGLGDIIIGGFVNTPARALTMLFTRGYIPYTQVVIVPVNSPAQTASDLNKSGVQITVQTGSTDYFRSQLVFPKATLVQLDITTALLSVATGKSQAAVTEYYLAAPFIAQHPNLRLLDNGKQIATEFGGITSPGYDLFFWRWLDNWVAYNTDNSVLPSMYQNIIGIPWINPS